MRVIKLLLTLICIFSVMTANSQNIQPDFAYPSTVSDNAEKDLNKAVHDGDAQQAFNALLRYFVAQTLIDSERLPAVIKLTEKVSADFSKDRLHGLYEVLLAKMYYEQYSSSRGKYDNRKLPATPLPEDMTEWSGEQYKSKIIGYALESVSGRSAEGLAQCPIGDYSDLLQSSPTAAVYFPTLLDFAFYSAFTLADYCKDSKVASEIMSMAVDSSSYGSAPYIFWCAQQAKSSPDPTIAEIELMQSMSDNEYAGYITTQIWLHNDWYISKSSDIKDIGSETKNSEKKKLEKKRQMTREVYSLFDNYIRKFPGTPFRSNIRSITQALSAPSVEVKAPSLSGVGSPFSVNIKAENVNEFTLNVYKLRDSEINSFVNLETLERSRQPVVERKLCFPGNIPFIVDTVIDLTLDSAGYYKIVPVVKGAPPVRIDGVIRCVPVYPIAISNVNNPAVAVVNPVTGAPISGVNVAINKNTDTLYKPVNADKNTDSNLKPVVTDKNGIAEVSAPESDQNSFVRLTYEGHDYDFRGVVVRGFSTNTDTTGVYHAAIVTDRKLYHPGEKLQLLSVISLSHNKIGKPGERGVCPDKSITIILYDPNNNEIAKIEGITDEYGRVRGDFDLPVTGLTGYFNIKVYLSGNNGKQILASRSVMVSDFKLPDFEVTDCIATNDIPSKGDVEITAKVLTYSGMPLANASATVFLTGKDCIWWQNPATEIFSAEAETDAEGNISVIIPANIFEDNKDYSFFTADIQVESSTGSIASNNVSFTKGKKYFINADFNTTVDGKADFTPVVEVMAANGSSVDLPLIWNLSDISGGKIAGGKFSGKINLKNIKPGEYYLTFATADNSLATPAKASIVIYNVDTDIVPSTSRLWVQKNKYSIDGNSIDILYGTPYDNSWVYCTFSDGTGTMRNLTLTKHRNGYHKIAVTIPEGEQRVYVSIFSGGDMQFASREIIVERKEKDKSLTIIGEAFRDRLIPGSEETWKIRIVDAAGIGRQSALMLDMYSRALDVLSHHDNSIIPYGSSIFVPLRINSIYRTFNTFTSEYYPYYSRDYVFNAPVFNYMYIDRSPQILYNTTRISDTMRRSERFEAKMMSASSPAVMNDMDGSVDNVYGKNTSSYTPDEIGATSIESLIDFSYRADFVPLAVWAPALTTDSIGNVCYSFTVPDTNTSWRLIALAWTKDFEIGKLVQDFVASKPLMVQPNLPRFLRQGDSAVILASVMNNSEDTVTATTVIELFNPVTGAVLDRKEFRQEIAPGISATVSSDITADKDLEAIGYSIRTSNGDFSDGEQSVIRILPSEAALIETTPFYLNPGETEFSTKLPDDKDARISLTFMENPSWTILTALPGLRTQIDNYANSAAAALYSAGIARGLTKDNPRLADAIRHWSDNPSDSTLVSMLEKNEDLKIALLNATPWVQAAQSDTERMASLAMLLDNKQVEASISKALDILTDLQQKDGGWKWSKWCNESSVWVTSNVLAMMADLKSLGWLPADKEISSMLKKAIGYYDSKVRETDILYAILRPQFGDIPVSSNGKSVIDRTIREISTDWKKYDDVAYKAMAAEALYRNKEQILAAELMRSISEFGVMTKDQGLRFPSVNALYNYAILLDAYALIKPGSKEVDGLRQQLIVRKQGADWGAAVVTTEVVQSILSSGSNWMVDAHGTEITVGNHKIEPTSPVEQITGWLRADLSSYAGKKLNIETSGTGPSYGAVYAQFGRKMTDVKAVGCDDLDIEKTLFVRRGTGWENVETLRVGDRVKVQLTIHCKRNLSYVSIIDERPACYEPVDQLPGWMWSEGVGFYRENRDSRTQLHVEYMAPGTYLLTYEMNVNNAGVFSSGVASIQSQYAPEISAHSSGTTLTVENK